MGVCWGFEKGVVFTATGQSRCGANDYRCVGRTGDGSIGKQIECRGRVPIVSSAVRFGLEQSQIAKPAVLPGHLHQGFMIDPFLVATKSAPVRLVLKY